jgi:chemotaxis protein MotB
MRRKKEKKDNSERWLLTYSDLITLLMIFFVVMYASSSIDAKKYEEIQNSFHDTFGGKTVSEGAGEILDGQGSILDSGNGVLDDASGNDAEPTTEAPTNAGSEDSQNLFNGNQLQQVESDISDIINNSDMKDKVSLSVEDRGLVISFSDNVFFASGQADINSAMMADFDKIANILNQFSNHISIEGHTDNVPIHNSQFSSNWQLSSIRAANVVQYLVTNDNIQPARLSAVGYGEYYPIASNDTEEGRYKNRRVNLVILYN